MTGIAAIFADALSGDRLKAMTGVLSRNPHDWQHQWSAGAMALSACTLATTAEALEVTQPLTSPDDQLALVFDGFLTNFEELRRDLRALGAILRTRSDEELILRAYEQWGEECAARIEGEFAFVIADQRRQSLFCARDHQGLRPLYYCETKTGFVAASSLAALLAALEHQPDYDYEFLAEVMIAEVYSVDRTVWKGVKRLKPAHCLQFSRDGVKIRQYYQLPHATAKSYRRDEEYIEDYLEVLQDAVRRTSRTHLPLGIEVSGGLDSSSIYCLAHQMAGDGVLPCPSIGAYTLRGEAGAASDEISFARDVASFTGTHLHEAELYRPDLDWFDAQVATERDMPTYTNAAQSILMEKAMVRNGARVALNGMGGDQWLDGSFGYYQQAVRARSPRRFFENMRRDLAHYGFKFTVPYALRRLALSLIPDQTRLALKRSRTDFDRLVYDDVQFLTKEHADRIRTLKREYLSSLPMDEVANANIRKLDALSNQRAFDLMYRQRSQQGLEGRSPMFTRQFIEFSNAVPEDLKFRNGQRKWIHRQAMRELMPQSIVLRDDKACFPERKHDTRIRSLCEREATGVLEELVNPAQFRAFCARRHEDDVDDVLGWPYWCSYSVITFLRNFKSQ